MPRKNKPATEAADLNALPELVEYQRIADRLGRLQKTRRECTAAAREAYETSRQQRQHVATPPVDADIRAAAAELAGDDGDVAVMAQPSPQETLKAADRALRVVEQACKAVEAKLSKQNTAAVRAISTAIEPAQHAAIAKIYQAYRLLREGVAEEIQARSTPLQFGLTGAGNLGIGLNLYSNRGGEFPLPKDAVRRLDTTLRRMQERWPFLKRA